MNRVRQPHTLLVLGLNAEMGTTAGADELVEIPAQRFPTRTKAHPLHLHCTDVEREKLEFQRERHLFVAYVQLARARTLHEEPTANHVPEVVVRRWRCLALTTLAVITRLQAAQWRSIAEPRTKAQDPVQAGCQPGGPLWSRE